MFLEDPALLFEIRQGIERETLRVDGDGVTSMQPHPGALGSKLTHPYITTDYSENLLEFITPVFSDTKEMLEFLKHLHCFTLKKMDQEYFWPFSMPAQLPEDDFQIPLADFGQSNVGRLKTLYRKGLGYRYGRSMQSISGVHYNFSLTDNFWSLLHEKSKSKQSLQEFKDQKYFQLIRNFYRHRWLLIYLFGASPIVDKSFLKHKKHDLIQYEQDGFYLPDATCLRMGGLGYTSQAQVSIGVCYNQLETYIRSLETARLTSFKDYEKIGLKKNGEYLQLNTNILQIDNEFYSNIRPKNVAKTRESALQALHSRGIEYIEVRLLDNDPFHPLGISEETIHFLHIFLIWCLFASEDLLTEEDCLLASENLSKVIVQGRDKSLYLKFNGKDYKLKQLLQLHFEEMQTLANAFGKVEPLYQEAFNFQLEKVVNPMKTPSALVMNSVGKGDFIEVGRKLAYQHAQNLGHYGKDFSDLEKLTRTSLDQEQTIITEDARSFDEFLDYYFEKIKINYG